MKAKILLLLFPLLLASAPLLSQTKAELETKFEQLKKFDPNRDAQKDIDDAVTLAGFTGKRILLDVGGEWCIWCRRLDSLFTVDAELDKFMRDNFVVVKVNFSKENDNEKVLSQFPKIPGYPHIFILGTKGELIHSQDTGVLENGKGKPRGHDREKVLAFLRQWAPPK